MLEKNLYTPADIERIDGISPYMLERAWAAGTGPRKTYVGTRIFIARDDYLAWLEKLRNPSGKAAKIAERTAAMLHEKAKRAGQASSRARRASNGDDYEAANAPVATVKRGRGRPRRQA